MNLQAWVALFVFVSTILIIAKGTLKSVTATLLGASIVMFFGLIDNEQTVAAIDHNTIGLLIGMMVIVGILSKTGIFQYVAVKAIKITKGNGIFILWSISFITAVLSAFLDNVTTVLLVSPIVLSLSEIIKINPIPLLMAEVISSNIGGTATLIGDPPNMIIGSYAGFAFNDFLVVLAPLACIVWVCAVYYLSHHYKNELKTSPNAVDLLKDVDEKRLISNVPLTIKSMVVIGFVLLGFLTHRAFHIEASVVAITAAAVLLVLAKIDDMKVLHEDVEWPTIIYFVALFILVGALQSTGVINALASLLTHLLSGNKMLMIQGILWISGLTCMLLNNVAFAAMFVHVVGQMATDVGMPPEPLYWALAMGSCLGGNGSYLGAAANAVLSDFSSKAGFPISFKAFMSIGVRIVIISLLISSAYLFWMYRAYI